MSQQKHKSVKSCSSKKMLNPKPYPQIKTKPYSKTITFLTWHNFPAKIVWGAHITFALQKLK
jgi:hypothetical protein